MGRLTQQSPNLNEESRTVAEILRHADYNADTFDNDICLLKLSSAVTFTNFIAPVCLAASGSVFGAGTDVWVTGWGNIQSGGETERCRSSSSSVSAADSCAFIATEVVAAV